MVLGEGTLCLFPRVFQSFLCDLDNAHKLFGLDIFSPQVLEMIAPPYSTEFVQLFLPIVRNEEITGRLRNADHTDDVSLFLGVRWF